LWLASLGRDRPFVYVTFGTEVAALAPVHALVSLIGQLDVDGVLTSGGSIDDSAFTTTPENLRVESWVPQQLLLQRASLLISHAGSGATLGAAASGVPHLCLPIAADQFENADAVTAAGAGLMLEPHEISPATLRQCTQELLTDPRFARRARRLADEIALMPEPSERVELLQALVR
jgi:MGT family glycosyltransferase